MQIIGEPRLGVKDVIAPHGLGSREAVHRHLGDGEPATFVQMARGLHFQQGALRFDDLAPSTIWILHPSSELVGQFSTGEFLDLWCVLYDTPRDRAPRARLPLLDPDAQLLGDPVLLVSSPRISGSGLTYDVTVLSGVLPEASGSCVLFIDSPARERRTDDTREGGGRGSPRSGDVSERSAETDSGTTATCADPRRTPR